MSRVFTLPLFSIAILLIPFADSLAQSNTRALKTGGMRDRQVRAQNDSGHSSQVTSELRRQQKFLRDVAARYEAVSVHDLTPLLSYSYVWNALRENRAGLASSSSNRLTVDQLKLIERGYDLLETDVLLLFVDHQLTVLNETLELDEAQYSALERILSNDLNQRRALLTDKAVSSDIFLRRLQSFSDQTERKLLSILSPEQRKVFHRQLTFNKDKLVG